MLKKPTLVGFGSEPITMTMAHFGMVKTKFMPTHLLTNKNMEKLFAIGGGCILIMYVIIKKCVNPAHLRIVTARENVLKTKGASAANSRKTKCKHGHQALVFYESIGKRKCLECDKIRHRIARSKWTEERHEMHKKYMKEYKLKRELNGSIYCATF